MRTSFLTTKRDQAMARPERVLVAPDSQAWFDQPSQFNKPLPIPENHWCYLGQLFCQSHVFNKEHDVESCRRRKALDGYRNIDIMKKCPAYVD